MASSAQPGTAFDADSAMQTSDPKRSTSRRKGAVTCEYGAPTPARPFVEEVGADPGRLRVGLLRVAPGPFPTDDECTAAVDRTAETLRGLGHEVREVELGIDVLAGMSAVGTIMGAQLRATIDDRLAVLGRDLDDDDIYGCQQHLPLAGLCIPDEGESPVPADPAARREPAARAAPGIPWAANPSTGKFTLPRRRCQPGGRIFRLPQPRKNQAAAGRYSGCRLGSGYDGRGYSEITGSSKVSLVSIQ